MLAERTMKAVKDRIEWKVIWESSWKVFCGTVHEIASSAVNFEHRIDHTYQTSNAKHCSLKEFELYQIKKPHMLKGYDDRNKRPSSSAPFAAQWRVSL